MGQVTSSSASHPAPAVWPMVGGGIRQHGDANPELNSSPEGELTDLQVGDVSPDVERIIRQSHTQPATDVAADRADIGTE